MGFYTDLDTAIIQSVMAATISVQPVLLTKVENILATSDDLSGFAGHARVATALGEVPIKALRVGDDIRTFSGRFARVQRIEQVTLKAQAARTCTSGHPVRILANAFSPGRPMQDIIALPEQQFGLDAHVANRFKTAAALCNQPKVQRMTSADLTFYQIHCDEAVTARVEGVWVRLLN